MSFVLPVSLPPTPPVMMTRANPRTESPMPDRTPPAPAAAPVTVYLVGAGPGDPGLITVAGAEALRRAAVVVYDYLANPRLLDLVPPHAQRIYVGKSAGQHTLTQNEINQLLVDKARELANTSPTSSLRAATVRERPTAGSPPASSPLTTDHWPLTTRTVVRLKGGDPYVFGRGGEEAETLRAAHIPFVVIPGITSGIAAPNYAGIPVTHRDFATTLTLITGHEKETPVTADQSSDYDVSMANGKSQMANPPAPSPADRINYPALAQLARTGTLCFYMGVKALPHITQKLLAAGLDPATPAAVIRWGTHPHQRTVTGTVSTIVDVVAQAAITAPAMTIIGKVVSLRGTEGGGLNWFEQRPLFGQTILVTRTRQQSSELTARLTDLGASVLEAPTIELAPPADEDWPAIDASLSHIPAYDWVVFTSANGVRAAWNRLRHLGFDARHFAASEVAAIGPATAEALAQIGIIPDLLPEKFVGEELAAALRATMENGKLKIANQRFLLLRADIARPVLRDELQKAGATVDDIPIYRTTRPAALPEEVLAALREARVNWITFTSASTADNFHALLPANLREAARRCRTLSIGPLTTAALQKLGWQPTIESPQHDIPGMVTAFMQYGARS